MVLIPLWHSSENTITVHDSAFNSATDSFILKLEHEQNYSRFSVPITEILVCEDSVKFIFTLNCSIPPGNYKASLFNVDTDAVIFELVVKMYRNDSVCISC